MFDFFVYDVICVVHGKVYATRYVYVDVNKINIFLCYTPFLNNNIPHYIHVILQKSKVNLALIN